MKKLLLVFLLGFIAAQAADYGASALVDVARKKCDPLWTQGKQEEYQQCMDSNKALKASEIVGFNFIYSGRKLIWGY